MKMFAHIVYQFIEGILNMPDHIHDIRATQHLNQLFPGQYLPWTRSAMRPSGVRFIIDDIIIHNRKSIIEYGSGISTIYIAILLNKFGINAAFTSIEHDKIWHDKIESILNDLQLHNNCSLKYIPLGKSNESFSNTNWYDKELLSENLPSKIDMIIVDGPPAYNSALRLSRYPAIPFSRNRLQDEYIVILDDIYRSGERLILKKWSDELECPYLVKKVSTGFGILQKGMNFTI